MKNNIFNNSIVSDISARAFALFALATLLVFGSGSPAFAQEDISDVSNNIIESVGMLPAFIAALAYLLGLMLAVSGVMKIKQHVENPGEGTTSGQAPLRSGPIRLLAGGALFSLPMIYEVLYNTISGGVSELQLDPGSIAETLSSVFGVESALGIGTPNVNGVLLSIITSLEDVPFLVSTFAYLLGLAIGVSAIIKLKEYVELPDQTTLKEPVIRFLVAGALFALPTIYNAMATSIDGPENGGFLGSLTGALGGINIFTSGYIADFCSPGQNLINAGKGAATALDIDTGFGGPSTGSLLCGIVSNTGIFPAFLSALAYLFGVFLGVMGILKVRDHVLDPRQTQITEGLSRFLAGGLFFTLPMIVEVFRNTMSNVGLGAIDAAGAVTGYSDGSGAGGLFGLGEAAIDALEGLGSGSKAKGPACADGLDTMLACFMNDIMGPMHIVLNFFAFVAGMILIMVGISRLLKSTQDGAKGPGGLGTMMTFLVGGALVAYNDLVRAASTTFTGSGITLTYAKLKYEGPKDDLSSVTVVISAVIKFMIIVGLISFVRGLFIVRDVAEGNQQASMMSGLTHIIGGTLAVNLGPLLNAVQSTLGITAWGISFT